MSEDLVQKSIIANVANPHKRALKNKALETVENTEAKRTVGNERIKKNIFFC